MRTTMRKPATEKKTGVNSKRNSANPVNKNAKSTKERFAICQFDPNEHVLVGTYLDFEHASDVTGIKPKDIEADIEKGTEKTGFFWLKSPIGDTVNHRIINKYAREKYKKIKEVKKGRRPMKREVALESVGQFDAKTLDDVSLRKIARIVSNAKKRK